MADGCIVLNCGSIKPSEAGMNAKSCCYGGLVFLLDWAEKRELERSLEKTSLSLVFVAGRLLSSHLEISWLSNELLCEELKSKLVS